MQADSKILSLFPSLNPTNTSKAAQKRQTLRKIVYLKAIADNGPSNISQITLKLKAPKPEAAKIIKDLLASTLIKADENKPITYTATTTGLIALNAVDDYKDWTKIKTALAVSNRKNDSLAYALLVIGYCANKPDGVYSALSKYAARGNVIENISADVLAESLLRFYRQELRAQSPTPPAYLSVFKEFTTAGFQEVFKMLLLAIKPTAEDYNWLIEFFNEVSEFYFDPSRIAFLNLLPVDPKLRESLEKFKKSQDQQIKKQDGNLEVTFNIPGTGLSKIDSMPPHLRAIGMRLILEPAKFINKGLVNYFWVN